MPVKVFCTPAAINSLFCLLHQYLFFAELGRINEHQKVALDLDPYVKKLLNARRRVVLVNNILQNAQVRVTIAMDFWILVDMCLFIPVKYCDVTTDSGDTKGTTLSEALSEPVWT